MWNFLKNKIKYIVGIYILLVVAVYFSNGSPTSPEPSTPTEEIAKPVKSAEFNQIGYVKINKNRIQLYTFDHAQVSSDEVWKHAKKLMNTPGKMTSAYYFDKNDVVPYNFFQSTFDNRLILAVDNLYEYYDIDDWKYAYMLTANGTQSFVDCTKSPSDRNVGLCRGD